MQADITNLLTPNCENCQALCCLALAFDKGDDFAIDKPAGIPCPNLRHDHQCKIHERLIDQGFSGCVKYSCLGAGQWVSALYGRQTWRKDPSIARDIISDFAIAREMREALELLFAAAKLPLTTSLNAQREDLIAEITPTGDATRMAISAWSKHIKPRHQAFLKSLRDVIAN